LSLACSLPRFLSHLRDESEAGVKTRDPVEEGLQDFRRRNCSALEHRRQSRKVQVAEIIALHDLLCDLRVSSGGLDHVKVQTFLGEPIPPGAR
jgi:hypothetical protein